jgi:hypothetical protein
MDKVEGHVAISSFGIPPYHLCSCVCGCRVELGLGASHVPYEAICPPCLATAHNGVERETWIVDNILKSCGPVYTTTQDDIDIISRLIVEEDDE